MLDSDANVQVADVQLLSSVDNLASFFARLGYDTGRRVVQQVEALGITNDPLRRSIRQIERLADEAALFQVYLFVLDSVTQANINALARTFRNRAGDFLLVLTRDFEELDFVLLQRQTSDTASVSYFNNAPPPTLRQLTLSVNRRKPLPLDLRVLRRFTYTEADIFAQLDKLKAAFDINYWSQPLFNNRAMFSDYFLLSRLPAANDSRSPLYNLWSSEATRLAMQAANQQLRPLYHAVRARLTDNTEATIRRLVLDPVLRGVLGFSLHEMKDAEGQPYTALFVPNLDKPVAVALLYPWGRNLDQTDPALPAPLDVNPTARAVGLLDAGAADWAIVSDGQHWRLYAAQAHSRATNYYEVDLVEALESGDGDALRYWLLLFQAAAFAPLPSGEAGRPRNRLDAIMAGSADYAKALGKQLKERIFEEVFPYFAEGFIRTMQQAGHKQLSEADRRAVFQGTLTFLYRLLFLLYAESRNLLPVKEQRGYWDISLERLKREVAQAARDVPSDGAAVAHLTAKYSPNATTLYQRLAELCQAVDKGDPARNVPLYNGGLFLTDPPADDDSPEAVNARFLSQYAIPDRYLALGLDAMARDVDTKTRALAMIDYKSLGVRQLGSIYEGLLEFTVEVAAQPMVAVRGKKKEELIVPAAERGDRPAIKVRTPGAHGLKPGDELTYAPGKVYLTNDKRERKVSGSYYTPDYIVEYIVAHTVGPVLAEKLAALKPAFQQAQATLVQEKRKAATHKGGDTPENQAYLKHKGLMDELFDLRVLDPAMGSGHFLVEAVDFITDRLLEFLRLYPWNPVTHALAAARHEILRAMTEQEVTVDAERLTDTNLLKRQVLKRCIYGVDLNPMAVELAKVSLWLDCFTLGAPLSFLDHHLKVGNSLIGARRADVLAALDTQQQLGFSETNVEETIRSITANLLQIGRLSDNTAAQVLQSRNA